MASACKCMYTHTQTHRHTHHIKIHIQRTKTYAYGKNVKKYLYALALQILSQKQSLWSMHILPEIIYAIMFFESPDRAAGEVAQWIAELSVQAWGPAFGSPASMCVCLQPHCWGWWAETKRLLRFAGCQPWQKQNKQNLNNNKTNKQAPWDRRGLSVRDPISKE